MKQWFGCMKGKLHSSESFHRCHIHEGCPNPDLGMGAQKPYFDTQDECEMYLYRKGLDEIIEDSKKKFKEKRKVEAL